MDEKVVVEVDGRCLELTNLSKKMWPQGWTKADLIDYYSRIAPVLLPYLKDRPVVLKRFPDGINGKVFYQKEAPSYTPPWVPTFGIYHRSANKTVHYIICNEKATLVWLASLGCIETHAFLARIPRTGYPDLAVMDLDPQEGGDFSALLAIALKFQEIFDACGLKSYVKTSGAGGLHLFIPIKAVYPFAEVVRAMRFAARLVEDRLGEIATVERTVKKRGNRIYLDYLQNGRGKTMAFPYSLRAKEGATVSCPLQWQEVARGDIKTGDFNLHSIWERLANKGDFCSEMLSGEQSLDRLLKIAR